jgi:hypothetical protein
MTVLILTHQQGLETDLVLKELNLRGIDVFRFNQEEGDLVSQAAFSFPELDCTLECDGKKFN